MKWDWLSSEERAPFEPSLLVLETEASQTAPRRLADTPHAATDGYSRIGDIDTIAYSGTSQDAFVKSFERAWRPCMITGVAQTDAWAGLQRWGSEESLMQAYGGVAFKVTEIKPPHGRGGAFAVKIPLAW